MAHPNRSKRALAGTGDLCRRGHVFGFPYSVSHVYAAQLGAQRTRDII
jgi:hypothetical protein